MTPLRAFNRRFFFACVGGLFWNVSVSGAATVDDTVLRVSEQEALDIAAKIWRNESNNDLDKLVWWNKGEEFASVGIGHFIWFPANYAGPFKESFPHLLTFMRSRGVDMPKWLLSPCPWPDYDAFHADPFEPRRRQLSLLLLDTFALQAQFLVARLNSALPSVVRRADDSKHVQARIEELTTTRAGRYALIDYVNFKGEGLQHQEAYAGHGWGLLQVLSRMRAESHIPSVVRFSRAAALVLSERVDNAPPARREERWLSGWLKRVERYNR